MSALFIPLSIVCTFLMLHLHQPQQLYRHIFLQALVIHGIAIILITEILSLVQQLTFLPVVLFWGFSILLQILYLRQGFTDDIRSVLKSTFQKRLQTLQEQSEVSFPTILCLSSTITIIGICLLTALIAVPNNYDSLTYHMPRVMHWLQNQSVAHYPTNNLRQISFQPGASYIVAQLQLLANGDYFANLVQWSSFLGSVIAVSLIAKIFDPKSTALAVLLCASIPMAVMQSTTTQTDLITGFWLTCYAYFLIKSRHYTWVSLVWVTASLGLAISTKATALFLAAPLSVLFLWRLLTQAKAESQYGSALLKFLTVQFLALCCSIPHFLRNISTFGNWLGEDSSTRVEPVALASFLINSLRNIALNFPFPIVWQGIEKFASLTSLSINKSSDTYGDPDSFKLFVANSNYLWTFLVPDEDRVASPLHIFLMLLILSYIIYELISRSFSKTYNSDHDSLTVIPFVIFLCGLSGFILFSGLVKWMEWNNRLILPLLVLVTASLGYYANRILPKIIQYILIASLSLTGIGYSLTPIHRPLVSLPPLVPKQSSSILNLNRVDRYYSGFGQAGTILKQDYESIAATLDEAKCYDLGLSQGIDDLEYPLWVSLHARNGLARIKHINVSNPSQKAPEPFPNQEICAVLEKTETGFILRNP